MASESKTSYNDIRMADLESLKSIGLEVYPHKFNSSGFSMMSTKECRDKFDHIAAGDHLTDEVAVLGRLYSIRSSSKNLFFFDLFDEGHKVQIMANKSKYCGSERECDERTDDEHTTRNTLLFRTITKVMHAGDYMGVCGTICKTRLGELSIVPKYMQIVSPCLHQVPRGERTLDDGTKVNGLTSLDTRYRHRYLDMIVNDNVRNIFVTRSRVISFIRTYLSGLGFIEVDTPVLDVMAGGATAKPFVTHSNDFGIPMYMRVAPELYLKRLVIGGLNKVFEIGRQYRNESNDMTHNCEFTSCEFYMRNADYWDLMNINEDMFRGMVETITGGTVIPLDTPSGTIQIDFTKKFDRIDMIPALEAKTSDKFPNPTTYASEETRVFFDELCTKHNVECSVPRTTARMLDKLVGHFIEPDCHNPTFIYGHPQIMSPLAKWDRNRPGLTERFELFINGMEYSNAYTELNDPKKQMECFVSQDADRKSGDDEAQPVDTSFVTAMEHGLPPTGGWGCGVDRLCMLLSNVDSIREVILFPTMKPINNKPIVKKPDEKNPETGTTVPSGKLSVKELVQQIVDTSTNELTLKELMQRVTDASTKDLTLKELVQEVADSKEPRVVTLNDEAIASASM